MCGLCAEDKLNIIVFGGEDEWLEIVTFGASWTLRVLVFTFHYICYCESFFLENLIPT